MHTDLLALWLTYCSLQKQVNTERKEPIAIVASAKVNFLIANFEAKKEDQVKALEERRKELFERRAKEREQKLQMLQMFEKQTKEKVAKEKEMLEKEAQERKERYVNYCVQNQHKSF